MDTSSTVSLLDSHSLTPLMLSAVAPTTIAVGFVTSSPLIVLSTLPGVVEINSSELQNHRFIVAHNLCTTAILGIDFLHKHSAIINFSSPTVHTLTVSACYAMNLQLGIALLMNYQHLFSTHS